jgi:hypothetical protein
VSQFSGPQGRGAMRARRAQKRAEAEARQAKVRVTARADVGGFLADAGGAQESAARLVREIFEAGAEEMRRKDSEESLLRLSESQAEPGLFW